jgi:type I restriction enzyme, R subunit
VTEEELAFYDAIKVNGRDVKVLGNETLCKIGVELVHIIRNNVTINWTVKEGV